MTPSGEIATVFHDLNQIRILPIFLILAAAWLLTKLMDRLFPWLADRLPSRLRFHILPSVTLARVLIFLLALWLIVPMLIEPSFQNLFAVLAAAGVALGFAFKDYVSGLVAGFLVIYERPYRVGDWVRIDGDYGEVRSIGARAMRLMTPDDTVVTIPHTRIWHSNVHNCNNGGRDLQCAADFFVCPEHDAALARQHLYVVALTSPYANLDRPIMVVTKEKPWGTHHRLKAYPVDAREQFQFISDLTVRGRAILQETGARPVTIPAMPAALDGTAGGGARSA